MSVSRDFVSVDMRGLKAMLVAHAAAKRVSVSTMVRTAVARELGLEAQPEPRDRAPSLFVPKTMKVAIRLTSIEAAQLDARAREAGLSRGAYVAGVVGGVAVLSRRADHIGALAASCGELATLNRNVYHLTTLLRQGAGEAALRYRETFQALAGDVRRHLKVAADALADMRPKRAASSASSPTLERR